MAFHPYPQLIPSVFNLSGFAPPQCFTTASHWPWVDHPASGPEHATNTPSIRIRFRYDYPTHTGSPRDMPLTRRLILQKARHHPTHKGAMTDCKHTVSGTISLPSRGTFHPSLTVLTTLSVTPSIQAYRVVPADSQQIPRPRCYSGKNAHTPTTCLQVPDCHRLRQAIPHHFP